MSTQINEMKKKVSMLEKLGLAGMLCMGALAAPIGIIMSWGNYINFLVTALALSNVFFIGATVFTFIEAYLKGRELFKLEKGFRNINPREFFDFMMSVSRGLLFSVSLIGSLLSIVGSAAAFPVLPFYLAGLGVGLAFNAYKLAASFIAYKTTNDPAEKALYLKDIKDGIFEVVTNSLLILAPTLPIALFLSGVTFPVLFVIAPITVVALIVVTVIKARSDKNDKLISKKIDVAEEGESLLNEAGLNNQNQSKLHFYFTHHRAAHLENIEDKEAQKQFAIEQIDSKIETLTSELGSDARIDKMQVSKREAKLEWCRWLKTRVNHEGGVKPTSKTQQLAGQSAFRQMSDTADLTEMVDAYAPAI